ncbi:MAG: J domain-containing protein [Odoribacteraceae bacterium]|jgi:hypothetical protein|nr:J domain-containing protein [Odoribacteraceae bacterium]
MDTTGVAVQVMSDSISAWFWIALGEAIVILLLLTARRKSIPREFIGMDKRDMKNTGDSANMQNIVDSIAKSKELYRELSRKCHPDRFVNTNLQQVAEEIFKEVSRNRRNYQKLLSLKQIAIEKLNLKF